MTDHFHKQAGTNHFCDDLGTSTSMSSVPVEKQSLPTDLGRLDVHIRIYVRMYVYNRGLWLHI